MKNIFKKFLCAAVVGVSCVLAANARVHQVTITPAVPLDSQQWNSVAVDQRLAVEGNDFLFYISKIDYNTRGYIQKIHVAYDDEAKNCPQWLQKCYRDDVSIQNGGANITARWCDMGQAMTREDWLRLLNRRINTPPAEPSAIPTVKFDPAGEAVQAGRKALRRLQIMMTPLGI